MTVLIVGGGKMGMSHLALATHYLGKPNVALCDTKLSTRLLFRFLGYQTFDSLDAAAARLDQLDGVLIATPTSSHAPLAHWAITRRVPFFVEKPLTLDVRSSEELYNRASSAGTPAQVGFVMRHVATFQRLRQLVAEGALGRLNGYTASMFGNVVTKPPAPESWQGDFSRGGGCLNEYGPHIIDLCCFIFGPVVEIGGAEMGRVYSSRADDRVGVNWVHDDSTPGQVEINWCEPSKRKSVIEFQAKFEYADVRVDNSAVEIVWHANSPVSPELRAKINVPVKPKNVGFYLRGEEFSLELEEFLGACVGRNFHVDETVSNDITALLKDGYEVDQLIDKIACKVGLK